jgi:heme/copper-type cytochrome/quinol oxidase subunit 2
MRQKIKILLIVIIGGLCGILIGWSNTSPTSMELTIKARQYAFDPPVLRVNYGDTLRIKLVSLDVTHGFFLEGYDIDAKVNAQRKTFMFRHPSEGEDWTEVEDFLFVADRRGKFRYRCSQTCGSMHPFMQGELIVEPNLTFNAGIGSVLGLLVGIFWVFPRSVSPHKKKKKEELNDESLL